VACGVISYRGLMIESRSYRAVAIEAITMIPRQSKMSRSAAKGFFREAETRVCKFAERVAGDMVKIIMNNHVQSEAAEEIDAQSRGRYCRTRPGT
jgi:hypothetical protein